MEVVHVKTQAEVFERCNEHGAVRGGSTIDPENRAAEYFRQGYRGTMFAALTTNMMKAEDRVLKYNLRHNEQKSSNSAEAEGYVYVIIGQKRQ